MPEDIKEAMDTMPTIDTMHSKRENVSFMAWPFMALLLFVALPFLSSPASLASLFSLLSLLMLFSLHPVFRIPSEARELPHA